MPLTILEAAASLRRYERSPLALLDDCLDRIDQFEDQIHAWVLIDREGAKRHAERLAGELKQGKDRGPLHGIPIGVKDIFDVWEWPTAAGAKRWANAIARRDCTVVERLREAGVILLGKTVTTAYASFDPPPTRNPCDLSRTPGGSSSGSAAAVAAGMCFAALGSQTGGSITRPASYCGVAGLKPSFGRISLDGMVPLAAPMDHPGVIAHCVDDLAIIYQTIAGPDERDPHCQARPVPVPADAPFQGTIGRLGGLFHELADPVLRQATDSVAASLARVPGILVKDIEPPPGFATVLEHHRRVMASEVAAYHGERLRAYPEDYPIRIRELIEEGLRLPATALVETWEHHRRLCHEFDQLFASIDILLTPATTTPPPPAATTGDPAFNSPWSYTGLPTVSLPVARTEAGLPLAVQLIGRRWGEAELFAAGRAVERANGSASALGLAGSRDSS